MTERMKPTTVTGEQLCELFGLDPVGVRSITATADVSSRLVSLSVEFLVGWQPKSDRTSDDGSRAA